MKKIYTLALAIVTGVCSYAQQLPLYSQYTAIPYLYNPAFSGQTEDVRIGLLHRSQWKGIPGAPVTSVLTADGPVAEKNIGLAGTLFQDQTDITQRLGFYTSYSYKLKINDDQKVLFGLSLGFAQQRIDLSQSVIKDDNDPMLMYRQNIRKAYFDATLGAAYSWKDLEVGFAVPQLIGNKLKYVNPDATSYYYLARHYVFSAKYTFEVNKEQEVKVYPLVLLRYAQGAPFQYDINAVFDWKKYGWAAITYRSNAAIGINVGVRLNNTLRAGYAYDIAVNSVRTYTGGAHEFFLGYTFGGGKKSEESPVTSNSDKTDSLLNALADRDEEQKKEIDKLKEEIEKLKAKKDSAQTVTPQGPGKNVQAANLSDFQSESGQSLSKGFYVVIGAYKSLSNAETAKTSVSAKFPQSDIIYNKERGFHYVYVSRYDNPAGASETLKLVQGEYADAWIFDLK